MEQIKPSKEAVRSWFAQRQAEHSPPPSPERIRQELGWRMTQPYTGPQSR